MKITPERLRQYANIVRAGKMCRENLNIQVILENAADTIESESCEGKLMRAALVEISVWWQTANPTRGQSEIAKAALERVSEGLAPKEPK